MGTEHVVYISSHAIQQIKGSCEQDDVIKVQSCKEVALDDNAIINGVITGDKGLADTGGIRCPRMQAGHRQRPDFNEKHRDSDDEKAGDQGCCKACTIGY